MTEKGLNLPSVSNKNHKFRGLKISSDPTKRALVSTPLTFSSQNRFLQGPQNEFDISSRVGPLTSVRGAPYHLAKTFSAFSTAQTQTQPSTVRAPIEFFVTNKRSINTPSTFRPNRLESKESGRNFSSYAELRPSKEKVYLEKFIFEGTTSPRMETAESSTGPFSTTRYDGMPIILSFNSNTFEGFGRINNNIKRPQTMGFFDAKADFAFTSTEHTQYTNETLPTEEIPTFRLGQGYVKSLKVETKPKGSIKKSSFTLKTK